MVEQEATSDLDDVARCLVPRCSSTSAMVQLQYTPVKLLERRPSPSVKARFTQKTVNDPRARCLACRLLLEGAHGPSEPPKRNLRATPAFIPLPDGSG